MDNAVNGNSGGPMPRNVFAILMEYGISMQTSNSPIVLRCAGAIVGKRAINPNAEYAIRP